jgi:hypothetical protein
MRIVEQRANERETMVGAKEIATWPKKESNTRVKHAAAAAA